MTDRSHYDVAVVGLGAMGSHAAAQMARRGLRVIGFDRYTAPHGFGSSSGRTRIIREAYFEDPRYVPLVQLAYELWAEMERTSGRELLIPTGGLMLGPRDGVLVSGALTSARVHGLEHAVLDAAEIVRRFPAFTPTSDHIGVWEPRAGALLVAPCIEVALERAEAAGAELHSQRPVTDLHATGRGIAVGTPSGTVIADFVVVAMGPWLTDLLPELPVAISVTRQVVAWLAPRNPLAVAPGRCPVWIAEWSPNRFVYGFPDFGEGAKVARHYEGTPAHPDTMERAVSEEELRALGEVVTGIAPGLAGPCREAGVCCYTNTPDRHFRVGRLPADPRIVVASPCSGHGFKFAPVVGEIVADLVIDGESRLGSGFGFGPKGLGSRD